MSTGNSLRARAAGTDVATAAPATLGDAIRRMEAQFAMAMPKGMEATRLVRDALTVLRQTPKVAECDQASVLGALMTCAQLGLRPGVLGQAWVLPFYDKKTRGQRAQLIVGYQGLVELAHRSGKIGSLVARPVYEADVFDVDYGLSDNLIHKPTSMGLPVSERGNPTHYYAVVKFLSGGHAFYVMSRPEVEHHRDRFAMARNREGQIVGPWVSDFDSMALKTQVRQLAKWMPKSTELANAIAADESVRVDVTPTIDAAEVSSSAYALEGGIVDANQDETPAGEPTEYDPTLEPGFGAS